MGGFECADHINRSGVRINLQRENQHDKRVYEDYVALKEIGISVVREGICWSEVEIRPYVYDFSRLIPFFEAAEKLDMQIIWDLCHFGYPTDLIPTHPQFTSRFTSLAEHFLLFHLLNSSQVPWIVPINEISFLSWHSGDVRGTVPFAVNSGWDIKYHLCKAKISAIKAIKQLVPETVILAVEPLVKVHPSSFFSDKARVNEMNNHQFQAMDILLGRQCPELGGDENLIDGLGFNYYYNNQWNDQHQIIPWPEETGKMVPLSKLISEVYEKYNKPLLLTETGHFGDLRKQWMDEICREVKIILDKNIPLKGICIYPVIDRPDWDDLNSYSNCGLWDLDENFNRIPHEPSIQGLKEGKMLFEENRSFFFNENSHRFKKVV